jgi:hypothetical protein
MKLLAGALALFAVLWPQLANSNGPFDDKFLRGTWTLFVRGYVVQGASEFPGTDLVAVATVTFDGRGGCESKDQIVVGGQFVPSRSEFRSTEEGGSCTYGVQADGTGFFDVTFPQSPVTNVTFVVVDRDRLKFIANNEGLGIFGGGDMERQLSGAGR